MVLVIRSESLLLYCFVSWPKVCLGLAHLPTLMLAGVSAQPIMNCVFSGWLWQWLETGCFKYVYFRARLSQSKGCPVTFLPFHGVISNRSVFTVLLQFCGELQNAISHLITNSCCQGNWKISFWIWQERSQKTDLL